MNSFQKLFECFRIAEDVWSHALFVDRPRQYEEDSLVDPVDLTLSLEGMRKSRMLSRRLVRRWRLFKALSTSEFWDIVAATDTQGTYGKPAIRTRLVSTLLGCFLTHPLLPLRWYMIGIMYMSIPQSGEINAEDGKTCNLNEAAVKCIHVATLSGYSSFACGFPG